MASATTSPPKKILVIGATGYIGGTVLHHILTCTLPSLQNATITAVIRGDLRIQKLEEKYGDRISCVAFRGLHDIDFLTSISAQHDIVVNVGSGFYPNGAEAMVRGLARRKHETGRDTWMLHISGTTNISDRPVTGESFPGREWDDTYSYSIYAFEKEENAREWHPQRATELLVLDTAEELGVKAVSVQAPCVFGQGEGLFQNAGRMVPIMMRWVLERGYGFYLGDGTGIIDYVHVADLADLYLLYLVHVLEQGGRNVPTGKCGIVFPTNGRIAMKDIAHHCLDVAIGANILPLKENDVRQVSVEEAFATTAARLVVTEVGWAGHRKTRGTIARERLGWRPTRGVEAWRKDIEDELKAAMAGRRGVNIGGFATAGVGR